MLDEQDYRLLLEKAPPGMEPVVRALKKNPKINNPYAVAWSMVDESGQLVCARCGEPREADDIMANVKCAKCESAPMSGASALVRGKVKASRRESFREVVSVVEAQASGPRAGGEAPEGHIVNVILLTEGLGNVRDRNYYGPEAVASMPAMFEGAVCMVDHPSYSEDKDIPEGRVGKTVGYYKRLRTETIQTTEGPKMACVGELHFDVSPEGQAAYAKACTAVHYGKEFPGSGKEYVGLSINAYGESEPRTMNIDGEEMDVNYVMQFVEVRSCDMVTIPARGGKFVALVESIAGAGGKNQEVRTMIVKSLKEARKAFDAAMSEKDADLRQKKVAEAGKALAALEAELAKLPAIEGKKGKEDEDESEADGDGESETEADGEMEDESDDGDDDADGADADDSHTTVTHKVVKKTGKAAIGAESRRRSEREAQRLAVKTLIKESGLSQEHFDMSELAGMSFVEAKREIARTKRVSEANAAALLKRLEPDLRAGNLPKLHESAGGKVMDNHDLFVEQA